MSLIKIIMLSFFGFTAVLLAIVLAFSFILPQRPKYDPIVPVVEISSPATPVVTPSAISTSHLEQTATPSPKPTVSQPSNLVPPSAYRPQPTSEPRTFSDTNSAGFRCAGKTHCSQMISCEEAKFYLRNCPGVKIDGNHDGIPCEKQWCK